MNTRFLSDLLMRSIAIFTVTLGLTGSVVAADLPIVAVSKFTSTVDSPYFRRYSTANPQNFEVMIETQLMKIGRFKVYERNRLDQILTEQGIQESLSGNGMLMKVDGVDYLLYGSITDYSSELKEINTGSFNSKKLITQFGVDVKIADARTSELRRAETVTVRIESANVITTGSFAQGEIAGDGLVEAQRKAAKIVASLLTESIFPISVVDVSEGDVYINYGDSILSVGDELKIVKQGRKLVDPQSGKVLGATETMVGRVKIKEVAAEFSIGEMISGNPPAAGDLARLDVKASATNKQSQQQRKPLGRKI